MNNPFETQDDNELISKTYQSNYYAALDMEMKRRLKDEIIKMDKSIKNFNKASSKQAKTMIKLTYAITILTVLIGVIAVIQIIITLYS